MTQKLTKYQIELLQAVAGGSTTGDATSPIDFDQLLDKLSWKPTKESAHFSIRALTKRGLIEKTEKLILRRGRLRVGFRLTWAGKVVLDPRLIDDKPEVRKTESLGTEPEVFEVDEAELDAVDPGVLLELEGSLSSEIGL